MYPVTVEGRRAAFLKEVQNRVERGGRSRLYRHNSLFLPFPPGDRGLAHIHRGRERLWSRAAQPSFAAAAKELGRLDPPSLNNGAKVRRPATPLTA
ncbi:hypothetical protein SKAU_G00398420 [Synaphobranchus kaupii]|uniref:Uncharacterized protein n=1 Tax=Synaphobranchus kaupii TaxID=118154 RepID=A0A9Q1E8I0_SYNKA|nr:hypothetical protein SKAU_G00398420 [Synaphobranchus kaupii]